MITVKGFKSIDKKWRRGCQCADGYEGYREYQDNRDQEAKKPSEKKTKKKNKDYARQPKLVCVRLRSRHGAVERKGEK